MPPRAWNSPRVGAVEQSEHWMRAALRLARRAYGHTSPNPMVGAVLVRDGEPIGRGWHRRAGLPHAEIEAIRDAERHGRSVSGATLYVTLEPCSTTGRTPPCTESIIRAGIRRVVAGATDPNPAHQGRGLTQLRDAGVRVETGILAPDAIALNEPFNHWIVHRTPWVTAKAGMTLDGKIATPLGQSKWITSPRSRQFAMRLRLGSDAVLVGINTVLADDPQLTVRSRSGSILKPVRRVILDSDARTPLTSQLVMDGTAPTIVVVGKRAPGHRVRRLAERVTVWEAPETKNGLDLKWLMSRLGSESVTHVLAEGGGEVHGALFTQRLVHRIAFFYAPKILGGRSSRKGVGGPGLITTSAVRLDQVRWRRLGTDLLLTARCC